MYIIIFRLHFTDINSEFVESPEWRETYRFKHITLGCTQIWVHSFAMLFKQHDSGSQTSPLLLWFVHESTNKKGFIPVKLATVKNKRTRHCLRDLYLQHGIARIFKVFVKSYDVTLQVKRQKFARFCR